MTLFSDPTPGVAQVTILNVDEREGPRYVKGRVLRRAGFTVLEASSGQAALSLVRQHAPALVLLPVRLPDIDGMEACRMIKNDPRCARTLVLQTSTTPSDARHRAQALDCGADSYLVEPVEPEELVASVKALLRMRHAEEGLRLTEQALRENGELFQQLADNLADVLWIFDPNEHRFVYLSSSFARMWGRSPETVLTEPMIWLDWIVPSERTMMREAFESMAAGGRLDAEFTVILPDGVLRRFHARAVPVARVDGSVHRIAGTCQDITQQQRAERMLREEESRKDEFLAMLAHELHNPLAPMRSAIDLLLHCAPTREESFRARDIIARQLGHLTRLVDDLLDVSRFTQGRVPLRDDQVELRTALNTAVEEVRPFIESRGQSLRVSVPDLPMMVRGDLVRLTQIFSNLLNNAARFSPEGGTLSVDTTMEGGKVSVRFVDNGAGLSQNTLDALLDSVGPRQGQNADGQEIRTGLGLALVKKLVALHQGRLLARSPGPGQGCVFTVELPAEPWRNWKPPIHQAPVRSGDSRSVLLVDDNQDALEAMQMTLEALGHQVVTDTNGASAIVRAAALRPDVILLDIGMPGMDGYETARRLRAQPETRDVRLIALTGYGQAEDARRALAAGFDMHLVKPIDLNELTRLLDQQPAARETLPD